MEEKETLAPVPIPYESLAQDSLDGIIKDFVLREGTDYGSDEYSLEDKIEQVKALLKTNKASIFFDPNTETCNILLVK